MNEIIEEIEATGIVVDPDGHERSAFPVSMDAQEGYSIYSAVRSIEATRTLEVGMGYGMSTLHICEALRDRPGAKHIVIDPYQDAEFANIGLLNCKRAGLEHLVKFYENFSHVILPRLASDGMRIDFALVRGTCLRLRVCGFLLH